MHRREFVVLTAATALLPSAALPQAARVPVVGFLSSRSRADTEALLAAFHQALREAGYVEGKSLRVEYRWADGRFDRLGGFAAEITARNVDVLVATGGNASALAAKNATRDIPVVFGAGGDPVKLGLVAALNRPGGNVTGITQLTEALEAKRLELLSELIPAASVIDALVNDRNPAAKISRRELDGASRVLGRQVRFTSAGTDEEIDAAFARLKRLGSRALIATTDPFLDSRSARVIALSARSSLPTMYGWREHALAGGLISYGTAAADSYRMVGVYVGRILAGAKPSDLPVQTTRVQMVVNRRTAKTLGLSLPQKLLVRADEVID